MNIYENNVSKFIYLLKYKPDLFSDDDRNELRKIISPLNDDAKELSNAIVKWRANHKEVRDALKTTNNTLEKAPGSKKANPNLPDYQPDKRTLLNAIQQSSAIANNDGETDKDDEKNTSKS